MAALGMSLSSLVVAIFGFFWTVRAGQFDDLDTPAVRILLEHEDTPRD